MKFKFTILLFLLLSIGKSFAQVEYLKLSASGKKYNTPFTKVNIIDNRTNSNLLGFIPVGPFGKIKPIGFEGNFIDSLTKYFLSTNIIHKQEREITLILNELFLGEVNEGYREVGRLRLHLRIFENSGDDKYVELGSFDRVYSCYSANDVSRKLLHSVNERFCEIGGNVAKMTLMDGNKKPVYSFQDLQKLDSIEKMNLPMFTDAIPNIGVYRDYKSFKMNDPEKISAIVDTSDKTNLKIYFLENKNGKAVKARLNNKVIYAVYDGNKMYKATSVGFYEMKKVNADFFFNGVTSLVNYGVDNSAIYPLGLVTIIVPSSDSKDVNLFQFKINPVNGNSMPMEKIR
jgi:hypothetical protein